jgi:hypothetical protein
MNLLSQCSSAGSLHTAANPPAWCADPHHGRSSSTMFSPTAVELPLAAEGRFTFAFLHYRSQP